MKNILVIGATGQIGSELTMELRKRYGNEHVVAGYIVGAEPKGILKESGPSAIADVTNGEMIANVVKQYNIDTIYNLAALLSVVAESKPRLAWKIGIDGLWNILEAARENHCAVFTPRSIGSFGESTPHDMTPQDTIQRPRTMYGVTKVTTELLSDYYHNKYGVDTRVQTAIPMQNVAEPYIRGRALRHLEKGRIVIFGAGIGSPYFSTDTTAALRAAEIEAEAILMAKNGVDGVYNADPKKDANAVKFDELTHGEVIQRGLKIMDATASTLSMDNDIDLVVFNMNEAGNIKRVVFGESIGTTVSNKAEHHKK